MIASLLMAEEEGAATKRARSTREFLSCCQALVRNVYACVQEEKEKKKLCFGLQRAGDRAIYLLGISSRSLYRLLKEGDERRPPGEIEVRERGMLMDEAEASFIRVAIAQLVLRKVHVTLDLLLDELHTMCDWRWGRSTLYRALTTRCGFKFNKRRCRYYERLREDPANVRRRAYFLKHFLHYHHEGREFVFTDESWLNKNMVPTHCWSNGDCFFEPEVPPGKGARWIMLGAGTKNGWIQDSFKMWKGNVQSEDYHSEMNGEIFEDWLKKLFPLVPPDACIIVDRAPYHTMLTPESSPANTSMKREELAQWLVDHDAEENGDLLTLDDLLHSDRQELNMSGVVYSREGWSKAEMLRLAEEMRPAPQYLAQRWVDEYNEEHDTDIKILFLPVAHPILNAIEMCWGEMKVYIRKHNNFEMATLQKLARERVKSAEQKRTWASSFGRTMKYAKEQWKVDMIVIEGDEEAEEEDVVEEGDEEEEEPIAFEE